MISEWIALILVLIGTSFSVIGMVGVYRLPNVYTQLHVAGKVGVLSIILVLLAPVLVTPLIWHKGMVMILFLLLSPVRPIYRSGEKSNAKLGCVDI
jgi:multicomponent Na+:H+ antiporter subunit G